MLVGSEGRKFRIHKGLLCHHSSHFRAALNSPFREGIEGVVNLRSDDVETFHAFYSWLYTQRLFDPPSNVPKEEIPLSIERLCRLFVFGDARGVARLRNAAIDAIVNKIGNTWKMPNKQTSYVYENTIPGSPLRRLFVDIAVKVWPSPEIHLSNTKFPEQFLKDVICALASLPGKRTRLSQNDWRNINKCLYHDHSDDSGNEAAGNGRPRLSTHGTPSLSPPTLSVYENLHFPLLNPDLEK